MKIIKLLLVLVTVTSIMLGVCGCMNNNITSPEYVREKALEYLAANYDDTFTALGYADGGWAYEHVNITFSSQKYFGAPVEMKVFEEDGNLTFVDNYYHCFMKDDAIEYFVSLLNEQGTVFVRFPGYVWSDELNGATTFSQWKESGDCCLDVFVLTKDTLSEDTQNTFVSTVVNEKISGTITFFTTKSNVSLSGCTLDDILNNLDQYIDSEVNYSIDSNFEISMY